ncbi:TPM domain-containing protein [Lichenifustis flavocetrariae]|uniref:TPM domain-containing protein n=1 Tax=Lichenifustis flavocetrariae TaxID=2949735 RepID=A0AA41YVL5_9HYPH|nr:TPM domain-containing protein [Lichenifustis flavocetrariae]MCW6508036.1 hypothetical protein [Lichenifustis flavocetrariae]
MIGRDDHARVCDAIRDAERSVSGEFVCVLARRASSYSFYPLAWAAIVALVVPWILVVLTPWSVQDILLAQLASFLAALVLLSWPPIRGRVVPRRVQRAAAHRAAAEQFLVRGLAQTPHRRGILLYVALDEHYARVLADYGAESIVPAEHWREAVKLLTDHSADGRHADGFVAALRHCVATLKIALPVDAQGDKVLPDKFYVID